MKRELALFLFIALSGFAAPSARAAMPSVPGEILVKFKTGISTSSANYSVFRRGAYRISRLGQGGYEQIQLPEGKRVDLAIQEFLSDPNVEAAQPNYIYKTLTTVPNDTHYSKLWGLKNTGQLVAATGLGGPDTAWSQVTRTSGADMDLESAWDLVTDCSSVVVAVVDTGVNFSQEDLADNIWDGDVASFPNGGWEYVSSSSGTNAMSDPNGHGTHVAGTIGARGNNSKGTTGVCWDAKIMGVRALDATGSGTTSRIVLGVNFAVTNGAKVINLSVGGSSYDSAFSSAITNARDNGVIIVAAAGNDGTNNDASGTPTYPCNYTQDNVICVAALTQGYGLASFSNYGSTSVDVGAPGVNIASSWPGTHVET
ncbi:MAG TPA: S8 family serine peptidase, partial [Pirellulales bacterium]